MKRWIPFAPLVFILLICSACKKQLKESAEVAMFRGDKKHSGVYSGTISDAAKVKWKFKTNGIINSSPAIAGNKLYIGSSDSNLYCLDANNGDLLWKFKTNGIINSSPAVAHDVVYFGSYDGNFYALNAKDGTAKWKFTTAGEKRFSARGIHGYQPKDSLFTDDWDFYLSSPVIDSDHIFFGTGSGYFYCLDAFSGKEEWKFKTDGIIHSSPAIAFGNVYFGGWDTYMHALNAANGQEVWRFKTGIDTDIYNQTGITSSPMIDDSIVYFGCRDSHMYAVNAIRGSLIWKKYNDGGWISVTPVVSGNKLLYASGSSRYFIALNKVTGDSIYRMIMKAGVFSSPAVCNDRIYYGDFNGFFTSRNIATGDIAWMMQLDASKNNQYHILGADSTFNIDSLNAAQAKYKNKSRMELRLTLGGIQSSPVIKNNTLYFGSSDGFVYALEG